MTSRSLIFDVLELRLHEDMKTSVSWDVASCGMVDIYHHSEDLLPEDKRQQVGPKRWQISTRLHGVRFKKTANILNHRR